MSETIQRAYRYRFYPSSVQVEQLNKTFGCTRFLYNYFLDKKQSLWKEEKKSLSYVDTAKELTKLKEHPDNVWLNEVSNVCLQQSLRALDRAYQNFFSKKARYPKKKRKRWNQSCKYMKNGFRFKHGKVYLAKQQDPLDIRWSRSLPDEAEPSSVTVMRDSCGRYYISILVEEKVTPFSPRKEVIGIDLGVETAITTSQGEKIDNPRPLRKVEKALSKAQRILSKRKLGSKNRDKQRRRVARLHAKVQDYRKDYYHKVSRWLINENQAVAVETLDVKRMLKEKKLSKSISDVGFSQLVAFLVYKAKWYGRQILKIDRWFPSSKMCSCCKGVLENLPLSVREWRCSGCGEQHDRDINAAKNVLWAAMKELSGHLDVESYRRAGGKLTPVECM